MDTCNEKSLCRSMAGFIEPHEEKPGFHLWRKVEGGRIVVKGVLYQSRKKDARPIALNRCPWCEAELKWGMTANAKVSGAGTASAGLPGSAAT